MNRYINRKLPLSQQIMKVPINRNAVPSVSSPRDPGSYSNAKSPNHRNENDLNYCNILPPAPRSQLTNYPPKSTMCPEINPKPYVRNSCYMVNNKDQGVVGLVCNDAGSSNNSNFVRGNEFSNDYVWLNQYEDENKIKDYTVEQPVQTPLEMSNPTLIYEPTNFYPTNLHSQRTNPSFRSYPQFKNYDANGLPIYTYPNKVLNPVSGKNVIEGFENNMTESEKCNLIIFLVAAVLIIIAVLYFF